MHSLEATVPVLITGSLKFFIYLFILNLHLDDLAISIWLSEPSVTSYHEETAELCSYKQSYNRVIT